MMADEEVGGLMVTDASGVLLGMVTTRDVLLAEERSDARFERDDPARAAGGRPVRTKRMESARQKLHEHRIEKLPLVDAGRPGGRADHSPGYRQDPGASRATKDKRGRLMVGVAVGVRADDLERAAACVEAGADVLVVDIAHGHSDHTLDMVTPAQEELPRVPVIAGNVATPEGVRDLAEAGADAVKVGVGAGFDLHHPHRDRFWRAAADRHRWTAPRWASA